MNLGLPYKGSKNTIANDIVKAIPRGGKILDACCGSGSTLLAAMTLNRKSYGFEVDRNFYNDAINKLLGKYQPDMFQAAKWEGKM